MKKFHKMRIFIFRNFVLGGTIVWKNCMPRRMEALTPLSREHFLGVGSPKSHFLNQKVAKRKTKRSQKKKERKKKKEHFK